MDKMLWISMSGAKENFHSLGVRSNNLANVSTHGFKADFENQRSMSVFADAYPTRAFAMTERPGYNFEGGAMDVTNRPLDVALQGPGFFAVADAQGNEAYTRFGGFEVGSDGVLRTVSGHDVLDEGGSQIVLPMPLENLTICDDGVITGRPLGSDSEVTEEYQRIKMVNPDLKEIEKGYDGFFRRIDGQLIDADPTVTLKAGMLEASNVNPVEELTNLIRIQRLYDAEIKMMQTSGDLDDAQNSLLSYT